MTPAAILGTAWLVSAVALALEIRRARREDAVRPEPRVLRPEPLVVCTREGRPTEMIYDADPDRRTGLVLWTLERQGFRILNSEKRRTS